MTTRGLVALGDSITNGHGEPALGVTMQSWAQWLAEALGLPFTKLARDGARARDVLAEQVPRLEGPYDVACLYVGVNDARSTDWDRRRLRRGPARDAPPRWRRAASGCCCARCPPTSAARGRRPSRAPRARSCAPWPASTTRRWPSSTTWPGPPWLLPDAVHPTARGQLEIADRAARALGAATLPSSLIEIHDSRRARARFTARWGVLLARDVRRRAVERVRCAP